MASVPKYDGPHKVRPDAVYIEPDAISVQSTDLPTSGWSLQGHDVSPLSASFVHEDKWKEVPTTTETWQAHVEKDIILPRAQRTWRGMYAPLRGYAWQWEALLGALCGLASGCIPICMTYIVGRAFAALSAYHGQPGDQHVLLDAMKVDALALVALSIAAFLLRMPETLLWLRVGERGALAWRCKLLRVMHTQPVSWYDLGMGMAQDTVQDTGAAGLMSLYASDMDDVRLAMGIHVGGLLRHIATLVGALGFALSRHWALTLVIFATVPVIAAVTIIGSMLMQPTEARIREQEASLASHMEMCARAITTIKAYTYESTCLRSGEALVRRFCRSYQGLSWGLGLRLGLGAALSLLTFVQGFGYGSVLVRDGHTTPAAVMSAFLACLVAMSQLQTILMRLSGWERGMQAAGRLSAICQSRIAHPSHIPTPVSQGKEIGWHTWTLENVTMAYPTRPTIPAVCESSMTLPRGACTFLLGASGSGKSSVAALFARLYDPAAGRVCVDGMDVHAWPLDTYRMHVLYVHQTPWLLDGSVRENLAPYGEVGESTLKAMLRAMHLDAWVQALPNGLDTRLGASTVIRPSGGQQQRLALARALLRDPALLILDEPTSALDRTTAQAVQHAIRVWRKGKTTLIITHDPSWMEPSDVTYTMVHGRIRPGRLGYAEAHLEAPGTVPVSHPTPGLCDTSASANEHVAGGETNHHKDKKLASSGRPTFVASAQWLWHTVPSRWALVGVLGVCLLSGLTVPAFSLCLTQVLVRLAQPGRTQLGTMIGATVGVAMADGVVKGLRYALSECIAASWSARLRSLALARVLQQDCTYFTDEDHKPSALAHTWTKDAKDAHVMITEWAGQGSVVVAMGAATWIWALCRGWQLTLCVSALVPVGAFTLGLQSAWLARQEQVAREGRAKAAEHVYTYAQHVHAARATHLAAKLYEQARTHAHEAARCGRRASWAIALGAGIPEALLYMAEAVLYAVGAVLMVHGIYDLERVLSVLSPLVFGLSYASSAATMIPSVRPGQIAMHRMQALIEPGSRMPSDSTGTYTHAVDGSITCERVSLQYPGQAHRALTDVSLHIRPGEHVALIGRSGSGKSSLLALLQRWYEPTSGVLRVDHVPTTQWSASALRAYMAVVTQPPVLLPGTIEEAITSQPRPLTWADQIQALKAAHADGFVQALPLQLATPLGPQTQLSGGQVQRLALARAYARRAARIWLMDEPTSALDAASRNAVVAAWRDDPRTMLIATHDPYVMQHCDRLLVLEQGRVVQSTTWAQWAGMQAEKEDPLSTMCEIDKYAN
ncbi:ABC-type transporter [Malassezia pachydermatis]|uniref:Plasma membrane atp-binding cassette transporter required for the export of a-factor n=1 Tax=Malassezia pachydermatis TaxID=77020 RepID=A0A0M9VP54_9BASI|nr:plasma membrane atp-binding cassette transporter required for the export of a-factor [Malassezia pachydermatis]KOS14059.1 plasma membrane atp-binding cassette transporter required for the export of a-factor [Malassezia pachydermatis]